MNGKLKKKIIQEIQVDINKCTGCRSCEMACSAFHATPKYGSINPARSRIRVLMDEVKDLYVPVRAGDYTRAECNGRNLYVIDGKEYPECAFCPVSCPSRKYFKEPDSGLPLTCDMGADVPPLSEPMCVQACKFDALIYLEREEEVLEEGVKRSQMEVGIETLIKRYGAKSVKDAIARRKNR